MHKNLMGFLFWTPRVLGMLFILFVSLFALDIFDMNLSFWETIVGLFMHLLPSIMMAIALILAWRWEWVGTLGFLGFGIWYIAMAWGSEMNWSVYAILSGVPGLIGALFLMGWVKRGDVRN